MNEPQMMPDAGHQTSSERGELRSRRQAVMAVLAEGTTAEIARLLAHVGSLPIHREIRKAESGLVMLRGRIGGDGAPFNVGEATVSRSTVHLESGEVGFGYVLGREHDKARLIAFCDALMQRGEFQDRVEQLVVGPIKKRIDAARQVRAEQAAATKVEFYTLVRGEG
jgi:alpha-D-ribose 1-methylphosphonate 5-triphosphate synthase subunit PhnG